MSKFISNWKPEIRSLLRSLVAEGCTIVSGSNEGGEDTFNFHPDNRAKFVNELDACDEACIHVRTPGRAGLAFVKLIFGNSPGELASDYTVRPEIEAACKAHYKKWDGRKQPKAPCPVYAANLKRHQAAATRLNEMLDDCSLGAFYYGYGPASPDQLQPFKIAPGIRFTVSEGVSCGQQTALLHYGGQEMLLGWFFDGNCKLMFPR